MVLSVLGRKAVDITEVIAALINLLIKKCGSEAANLLHRMLYSYAILFVILKVIRRFF